MKKTIKRIKCHKAAYNYYLFMNDNSLIVSYSPVYAYLYLINNVNTNTPTKDIEHIIDKLRVNDSIKYRDKTLFGYNIETIEKYNGIVKKFRRLQNRLSNCEK